MGQGLLTCSVAFCEARKGFNLLYSQFNLFHKSSCLHILFDNFKKQCSALDQSHHEKGAFESKASLDWLPPWTVIWFPHRLCNWLAFHINDCIFSTTKPSSLQVYYLERNRFMTTEIGKCCNMGLYDLSMYRTQFMCSLMLSSGNRV